MSHQPTSSSAVFGQSSFSVRVPSSSTSSSRRLVGFQSQRSLSKMAMRRDFLPCLAVAMYRLGFLLLHRRLFEVLDLGADDLVNVGIAVNENLYQRKTDRIKCRITGANTYVINRVLLVADLVDGSHQRQMVDHSLFDQYTVEFCGFAFSPDAVEVPLETVALASPANPGYVHIPVVRDPDFDVVSHRVLPLGSNAE